MRKNTKNILLLTNAHNCMSQRLALELRAQQHKINVQLATSEKDMLDAYSKLKPDLVLCPFLTKKVPEAIYKSSTPCVIVHPGIKGDRGISSLDWAVNNHLAEWGVTFLSAAEEMDAGPIWSSLNFKVPPTSTKSFLYRTQVVKTAVKCLEELLYKLDNGIAPEPLDYTNPEVRGTLMPRMKDEARKINWDAESLETVLTKIRCSDSTPGAIATIEGAQYRLFNPFVEGRMLPREAYKGLPNGTVVGQRNGAILIKTKDAPLWISHLKKGSGLKIPAMSYFKPNSFASIKQPSLVIGSTPQTFQDIWINMHGSTAHLHFNFLNGAMSTEQLIRLRAAIDTIGKTEGVKIIVLRGGEDFFSNGINLNTIESAKSPFAESYRNINAINDCIKSVFSIKDKIVVAYLEGNAGAGGAMMPLACDFVYTSPGVVLNPHYKSMGLFGSEYWTYWLRRRVGDDLAQSLTENCHPVLARDMVKTGMIDEVVSNFTELNVQLEKIMSNFDSIISKKMEERTEEWLAKLESHRDNELGIMRENFAHSDYQQATKSFVYKLCPKGMASSAHIFQDNPIKRSIDCKSFIEEKTNAIVKPKIEELKLKLQFSPKIVIIQVEDEQESTVYVQRKKKVFEEHGFAVEIRNFMKCDHQEKLKERVIKQIELANKNETVHGIILQLPLPREFNPMEILELIDPLKNIDGFSANNFGRIALMNHFDDYVLPCTVRGVVDLIDHYGIKIQGKNFTVIGKGIAVGMPLSLYLMNKGATVTVCDRHTRNLKAHVKTADVVISASSSHHIIDPSWVSSHTIVLDVGTKVVVDENKNKKILGNLNSQKLRNGFYTRVPGGLGGTTVLMAMMNTLEAGEKIRLAKEQQAEAVFAEPQQALEAEEEEDAELEHPDAIADL